jgi:hypothetical protein
MAEPVRVLLDPQRRGRQFLAARLVRLAGWARGLARVSASRFLTHDKGRCLNRSTCHRQLDVIDGYTEMSVVAYEASHSPIRKS